MVKYYYAGSQRVAMRVGSNAPSYLLGDHLGSTSLTANSSGGKVAELRYYPYGETRFTDGVTPTSYQFTGQRNDSAIGLYFYNARYYDPYLNRFIQADSIVPSPANPQSLNRYSYVLNSPLRYTDPTGHYWCPAGSAHCIDDVPLPRSGGAGVLLRDVQAGLSAAEQAISVLDNAAQQLGHKSGIPRYETNLDGWKMAQRWRSPLYDINFEIGHKQGVRFGESPWLVTPRGLRHYSENGNNWIEIGACPPYIAQGTTASRNSSSYDGVAGQTEIRQTSMATIEGLGKLNIQVGAEQAFSGKFPGVEGRDVYYMHLNATYHGDRAAALTVATGVFILGPKAWAAAGVLTERITNSMRPVYAP